MRARSVPWLVVVGLFLGCGGGDDGGGGSAGAGGGGGIRLCGNGVRDGAEQCDGNDLGMATCPSMGKGMGVLRCNPMTCIFDVSMCGSMSPGGGGGSGG
jgi:hypothetical protein